MSMAARPRSSSQSTRGSNLSNRFLLSPAPSLTPPIDRRFTACAATASFFLYSQHNVILCLHHDTLAIDRRFEKHLQPIQWIAVDNVSERGEGRLVVSYDESQITIIWDLLTGDEVARFASYEEIRVAAWMRNGNIAFGNSQGNVIVFEPANVDHISARTIFDPITALAPKADCRTFAIGYQNGSILIATLQPSFIILHNLSTTRAPSPINALAWHGSPSKQKSDMLAAQTADGHLRIWSIPKSSQGDPPSVIRVLRRPENDKISGPCWFGWSKLGRIVQCSDDLTFVWDVRTKRITYESVPTVDGIVGIANYGPSATLFTLGGRHTVQQYDLNPNARAPVLVQNVQHEPAKLLPLPPKTDREQGSKARVGNLAGREYVADHRTVFVLEDVSSTNVLMDRPPGIAERDPVFREQIQRAEETVPRLLSLSQATRDAEGVAAGLGVFENNIPEDPELHLSVKDLLRLTQCLRSLFLLCSPQTNLQLNDDIDLLLGSLKYTLSRVRKMFNETRYLRNGERLYRVAWDDMCYNLKNSEDGQGLRGRLSIYELFTNDMIELLKGYVQPQLGYVELRNSKHSRNDLPSDEMSRHREWIKRLSVNQESVKEQREELSTDLVNELQSRPNPPSENSRHPTTSTSLSKQSTVGKSTADYTRQSDSTKMTLPSTAHHAELLGSSTKENASPDQTELNQILANKDKQGNEAYSEAGSIADYEDIYANVLQNELLQDLKSMDLTDVEPLLSLLLEEFAIRIGHQGESRGHQNMMYFAHKHRRKIARATCQGHPEAQEDDASIDESAQSEETDTRGSTDGPAYYSNMKNIADWNEKNEPEIPDTYSARADPWEDKLNLGHEALRESEAYKWLVSAVQRNVNMNGVQPSYMESHRQWLLTMLETNTAPEHRKISPRRRPVLYTAKFELSWNLIGFLREQEYADEDLHAIVGRVITLSGDHQFVQALPCKEYMEQIWPSTSADILWLLERLVEIPAQTHERILPDKTRILAQLRGDSVSFEVIGTTYGLAEVTEQLFWVSTALQIPTDAPGASLNFAEATATFVVDETIQPDPKVGVLLAQHVGMVHCNVKFKSEFLDQEAQFARGHCWHNLFRHCAIVSGYPIPSRPSQRPGLEVPFDIMAALARAERITPFCGNLVLNGFSTLLFPTCYEDRCMVWHLIYNEDGSRVSFTDNRISLPAEMESAVMQLRPDHIDNARHIVGWAAKLKKNTGVDGAKYEIGWSALSEPSPGFALEKVQICAGQYVTVGGTFVRGKREKAVHIKGQDDYVGRLKSIGDKFIVLHDIKVRRAWLVDGLSALLHLIRAKLTYDHRQDDYGIASLLKPEELLAKGKHSGRKMAFETLSDSSNMKLHLHRKAGTVHEEGDAEGDADFYCLIDAVKDIMHILEQIIDLHADERAENSIGCRIRKSPWKQLEGFDFMDIATNCNPIWSRATTLHADGEGWFGLTRAIHATTLFGKGFGELLEPVRESGDRNHCVKCCWNSSVPTERDVLAVSISELERIVERRGSKSDTSWRLVDNFHLDFPSGLFSACSQNERRSCRQRVQSIRRNTSDDHEAKLEVQKKELALLSRILRLSRRRDKTASVGKDTASPDVSAGGVLLGMMLKRHPKNVQESNDAEEHALTRGEPLSGAGAQTSHEVGPLQVVSASSSSHTTTQDTSTTVQANSESTSLTEPSILPSPASPAAVTGSKGKGNLRDSTI